MGGVAWVFPGQGSQKAGMGRELAGSFASARRIFADANEVLGFDLMRLCFEGPEDELQRTANAQPALLTTSIAALAAAKEALGGLAAPTLVAGHSLGEFTALVAAEVLAFADALRLVRRRGELMEAADTSGGMIAVIGLDADVVARAIDATGCVVANDNAPGQVVVSGAKAALEQASAALSGAGAKRLTMRPVGDALASAMSAIPFQDARVPVVSNVDAEPHTRATEFSQLLARQVYSPVRWAASVRRIEGEGVDRFIEFGAGAVLTGLVKRIVPGARALAVQDSRSIEEAATVLR
ncbi:MAG: [acyl-carrier-protein] S-malonyltransferase [Chloroflexi bacterium 13_1_40CM_4_68_4]|nr:MAG: [acyl-carrier-protein] S-malonyltransferase [Chloroflexi bacterium 13_1_40CM_4_68_4]